LLDKVKNEESEEHQKNNIRDFLLNTYDEIKVVEGGVNA